MSTQTGSYTYGTFASNEAELARLESQATVAWPLEKQMLSQAGLSPGMDVLDLACGPGFITERIGQMVAPGGSVIGGDINEGLLDIARRRTGAVGSTAVTFQYMDTYDMALPAASVDFVYSRFLFQHLEFPQRVMAQISRVLRPGGTVSIIDVDDGILGILPEPPGYEQFTRMVAESQARRGGDRNVGRKLGYLLKHAGFQDVRIDVSVVTSDQISMQSFLDITTGFKRELVPSARRPAAEAALEKIYAHALSNEAFGIVGVYSVTGTKG